MELPPLVQHNSNSLGDGRGGELHEVGGGNCRVSSFSITTEQRLKLKVNRIRNSSKM